MKSLIGWFFNSVPDEWNKFRDNTVIEMKDINESGYSSCKATTPELVENHVSRDKDDREILAEALSEIDSPSPIIIKEGQLLRIC